MLRQAIQMAIRLISANLFMLMLAAGLVILTFLQCALMLAGSVCAVFRTGSNRLRSSGLGRACFLLFMGLVLLPLCGCEQKQEGRMPPGLAKVRYVEVSAEKVTLTRELPGRISAFKVSEVRPQVGGILQARLFEEGTDIEAGQVLYQIDPALYQAAYNNARANLVRAQANEEAARLLSERYSRLIKSNSVSRQERDDATAAYHQVKAEITACEEMLASAAINLGYTRITAPVSGRIGRSLVTEGALVTQHQEQPLARIQQISPVYVDLTRSSSQMLKLRRAVASGAIKSVEPGSARVRLSFEDGSPYTQAESGEWLEGDLLFSDFSVDETTGTVSLRARFDNPEGLLLPGMYVRAVLVEGVMHNAVLVPQRSVTRDTRNLPQVFVLTPDGRGGGTGSFIVEARNVTIDRDHEGRWLLSEGLAPGELLLVDGVQKVRPGQKVTGLPLAAGSAAEVAEEGKARKDDTRSTMNTSSGQGG